LAKSNQGGIETGSVMVRNEPKLRQNRTKVGLKHCAARYTLELDDGQNRTKVGLKLRRGAADSRASAQWQNRTKVGLKLNTSRNRCITTSWAKSNQGGIETCVPVLPQDGKPRRQNRTKVGLKRC